jgi:hypothetical protein
MAAGARDLDSDGFTTIVQENWPDIFAGTTGTAKKFGFENNGDRPLGATPGPATGLEIAIVQVGANDGSAMLRIGLDTVTLSQPWSMAAALGPAGGVWGSTGTRGWKITALNATGETIQSFEVTFNVTDTSKKVTLTWVNPPGTTQNKVYRTDTPGTYGATSRRATIAVTTTYDDDGAALSAGQPPSENTSGGAGPAFGTPPALGTTPLQVTLMEVGRQKFYWVNRVVPGATSEDGNPRSAITRLREV